MPDEATRGAADAAEGMEQLEGAALGATEALARLRAAVETIAGGQVALRERAAAVPGLRALDTSLLAGTPAARPGLQEALEAFLGRGVGMGRMLRERLAGIFSETGPVLAGYGGLSGGLRGLAAALPVYGAMQDIRAAAAGGDTGGATLAGMLSGAAALNALMPGVGAVVGGVLGGIFGHSAAEQAREREAQRAREDQLDELRRISAALAPVTDYFRRGGYGALTSSLTHGAGLGLEYAWAVDARRGERW